MALSVPILKHFRVISSGENSYDGNKAQFVFRYFAMFTTDCSPLAETQQWRKIKIKKQFR